MTTSELALLDTNILVYAFDCVLVATMQTNGVRRIYTYNRQHFTPFPDIEVLTP